MIDPIPLKEGGVEIFWDNPGGRLGCIGVRVWLRPEVADTPHFKEILEEWQQEMARVTREILPWERDNG